MPGKRRFVFATFGLELWQIQCSSQASGQVSPSIYMPNDTSSIVVLTVLTLGVKTSFELTGAGRCNGQDDLEMRGGEWEDHKGSQHEREWKKPGKNGKKH